MSTAMNDVTSSRNFEQKLMDRLRDSMGELMTVADLKQIVERGVDKILFQERTGAPVWGGDRMVKPCLVEEILNQHLMVQMRLAVNEWIKENPEALEAALEKSIRAGVARAVLQSFDERIGEFLTPHIRAGIQEALRGS